MNVVCKPIKEVSKSDWGGRIIACTPLNPIPNELKLNRYGNFTLSGSNLDMFNMYEEYHIDIRPDNRSKYPASYIVTGFQGIDIGENITVDPKVEFQFLKGIMSQGQAENVHTAYPNFIELILNNREAEIDYKNIPNVGPVYLEKYIDKIKGSYKSIFFMGLASEWEIKGEKKLDKLMEAFVTPDEAAQALQTNPYRVLVDVVEYGFEIADAKILQKMPEMIDSKERCEYGCLKVLKENESPDNGGQNTRIKARILANLVEMEVPEAAHHVVDVIKNGELIYYDPVSKNASIRKTYEDERFVADEILRRVGKVKSCGMDWEKFRSIDGFECTDEQAEILRLGNERSIAMLNGSAGCVDGDTEFFNGEKWKRIAEYEEGDMVLQYNEDGKAELVYPEKYIKEPCESLWHFETKYGVNQTVCDDHRIIYWSQKGFRHECKIEDIITKQLNPRSGWTGKFETSFSYSGEGIKLTDSEIKVMCAVICDGSFITDRPNSNYCRFHIKKDRKKTKLREVFTEACVEWREAESATEGYTDFYINAPIRTKEFGKEWYSCSKHQLEVICENIMFWYGSENTTSNNIKRQRFSTTSKQTADFVQFAYTTCGYRASIYENDRSGQAYFTNNKTYTRKSVEYVVGVSKTHKVGICCDNRKDHEKTIPQKVKTLDGHKYCFTVSSGALVLRRKNNIFITGNCGKSTAMACLIKMLEHYMQSYTILAPTGVASKRIAQTTGRNASTIHMFLARLQDTFCSSEYVIIDEFSMVGVELLARLFSAIPNSKIILIGDEAQLASISCGNVLYDLVCSDIIPRANLTKVFRYGVGGISTVAADIREGRPYLDSSGNPTFHAEVDDYKFTPISSNLSGVIPQVLDIYEELLDRGYNKTDIMVLSPQNVGDAGTYKINEAIQTRFNNHVYTNVSFKKPLKGEGNVEIKFKVGDRVVNTRNNYKSPVMEQTDNGLIFTGVETLIANGDIGYVRDCVFDKDLGHYLVIQYDENLIGVHGDAVEDLLLGYAISIHKSQGSQSKAVVLITHKTQKQMIKRNILYVGASRAQEYLAQLGEPKGIEAGLEIEEQKNRDTWLQDMLKEGNIY